MRLQTIGVKGADLCAYSWACVRSGPGHDLDVVKRGFDAKQFQPYNSSVFKTTLLFSFVYFCA